MATLGKVFSPLLMLLAVVSVQAQAVCYQADASNSDIKFQFAIERSHFTGHFTDFKLDYCWQNEAPETGNINVIVNIASVQTGNSDLNIGMQEKEGLNTDDYPQATWTTESISKQGDGYFIKGQLRIRGVTHEQNGHFKLQQQNGQWHLTGSAVVKRLEYNIGIGEYADIEFIPNAVSVDFDFVLKSVTE